VKVKPAKDKAAKASSAKSQPPASAKPATKPVAKPAAKPVVAKSAKAAPAPVKAAAKPPVKAVAKAAVQPAAKTAAKPAAKPAAAAPSPAKSAAPAKVVAKAPVKPAAVAAVAAAPAPSPKPGRPSSRLAQLTVPSMAQSVASTAAKASYNAATSSQIMVPMLTVAVKKDPKLVNSWKTKALADLTDADLIAMPDSEYMNDVQMAAFRLKLLRLKQDILNSAGETTEHLREDTSVVPDPADRATIEEEHALELRTRDRERKLLKKIEQSIARIDAGDYGYCDETGEPIGVGRLLARPTATLSLEAQQRRELKQKMFGD